MEIPRHVLASYGLAGVAVPLTGGSNRSSLLNNYVIKPLDDPRFSEWAYSVWSELFPEKYRISRPLRADTGNFITDGWGASAYERGNHENARLAEKLVICRALHADLSGIAADKMPDNNDPWARAHRIAWQTDPLLSNLSKYATDIVQNLLKHTSSKSTGPTQIIHADLSGNILFDEELPPLVIDFSPFTAPAAYAEAILVCDCIAWQGSPLSDLASLPANAYYKEMLTRAIVFRLSVAAILNGQNGFEKELSNFGPLIQYMGLLPD
jgi:uncharacterized protein (TIGR02569 family)